MADENFAWQGSPSQVTNMGTFIVWGLLALTFFLAPISAGVIIWKYLVVKNRRYELTSQRFRCHSGVLSKTTDDIELYRVKDTKFEQPFFLRLFGLGNVKLMSSDLSTPVVTIEAVPNARELRETIKWTPRSRQECI
jgi:uncharacterized membrane protein YdbT with pleckstrin-like domain